MSETPEQVRVLQGVVDELVDRFGKGDHEDQIVEARTEYMARAGKVFEEDAELYEQRVTSFLEWYVVERPLQGWKIPPAAVALRTERDEARRAALWAWLTSHRSVFTVEELGEGHVLLTDIFGGAEFRVEERRRLHGVGEGDLLEARVLGYQGMVLFGKTFLFHPPRAREALLKHAERIRKEGGRRADMVDYAARLRIRAERFRHVPPEKIYDQPTGELLLGHLGEDA